MMSNIQEYVSLMQVIIKRNVGIIHVFACIKICRVSRKLFELEAARPRVQTSSKRPGECLSNEINM